MLLAPGARLGVYEVVSPLGAGGMGEVYRARDTRLHRDVAIKILPEGFASDPDRLARFEREAQILASLNHPHIAQIYGIEDRALVMELVDGETLADRIVQGPIPIDEAMAIAQQIAGALEAAHDQGIVHRDLKPSNIKITLAGAVKVLDFGLAKLAGPHEGGGPSDLSMFPTFASPLTTGAGTILGTAAYMSPEQARGKVVDRRADIWAFGCVLYEMLTGNGVFQTETVSDAIAAVLTRDPDWSALPPTTPLPIRRLLRRCLQKDPRKRLPHIGVATLEIEDTVSGAEAIVNDSVQTRRHGKLWTRALPIALGVLLGGAAVAGAIWWRTPASSLPVSRFIFTLPDAERFSTTNRLYLALSPDGSHIAYVANNALHLKSMVELRSTVIAGTENSSGITNPVFSPDGRWIAYWTLDDLTLRKIPITGGAPVTICRTESFGFFGMSWNGSTIVFGEGGKGIMRVSADGGRPDVIATVKEGETAHGPQLLADGDTLLFTLASGRAPDRWDTARIVAQSLKSGTRKIIINGGSDARYLPSGHLVYALRGTLLAAPFDVARLELTGSATPILDGVRRSLGGVTGAAQYATSNTGSLIYVSGPALSSGDLDLALVDRGGVATPLKLPAGRNYEHPRVSPDGTRVAFATDDGKEAVVWIYDLAGTTAIRRLTFGGRNLYPIWSSDGQWIVFQSDREGDVALFMQQADGTGAVERLTHAEPGTFHVPESWSPGSDTVSFAVIARGADVSLWTLSVHDKKASPVDGVHSTGLLNSAFSPDGTALAYITTAGVFIQPFPPTGSTYQVESLRGVYPVWSRDGRRLFYTPPGQLLEVDVRLHPSFAVGKPISLPRGFIVQGSGTPRSYDLMPDGRFLGLIDSSLQQSGGVALQQITVVLNWFEELRARVAAR